MVWKPILIENNFYVESKDFEEKGGSDWVTTRCSVIIIYLKMLYKLYVLAGSENKFSSIPVVSPAVNYSLDDPIKRDTLLCKIHKKCVFLHHVVANTGTL